MKTKLPNFIVVGAPKAGTTSLYHYLKQHPDVYLPRRKELHYHTYDDLKYISNGPGDKHVLHSVCKSLGEYERHYKGCKSEKAVGEVSPSYLYLDESAKRIKALLGNIKIVILLRHPVEKAYSQYMHLVSETREDETFQGALDLEANRKEKGWSDFWRYKDSSKYSKGIKSFYDVFGQNNVKVIITEKFLKKPNKVMQEVFAFLDVDPDFKCDTSIAFNKSGPPKSKLVARLLVKPNMLLSTAKKIIPSSIGEPVRRFITSRNSGKKIQLSEDIKQSLLLDFKEDIEEIELLTGTETGWLKSVSK